MRNKLLKLSHKHQQLARLLVSGNSQAEAARLIGMSRSAVCRLIKDPLVAQEMHRLQQKADDNVGSCVPGIPEKISEGAHRSIEVIMEILNDKRDDPEMMRIKANVSLDLLSRAGYGPIKQVKIDQRSISARFVTEEDIVAFKARH